MAACRGAVERLIFKREINRGGTASMINANGKTSFAEYGGQRFAREPSSALFVPETVALWRAEPRAPAPPPSSGARRVAMLIDGDNAQPSEKIIKRVLSVAQKRGDVTVRRVYGNWSSPNMSGWSEIMRSLAMRPVHQIATASGKNAADIALAIDAMDLMLGGMVNGFCIVSSDSDYTALAIKIREQGMFAIGAGRKNTPKSFVNACDEFVVTDDAPKKTANAPKPKPQPSPAPKPQPNRPEWARTIAKAIDANKKADGWANLGEVAAYLNKLTPPFKWKDYGHAKLSKLVKSCPELFETRQPNKTTMHVRSKP